MTGLLPENAIGYTYVVYPDGVDPESVDPRFDTAWLFAVKVEWRSRGLYAVTRQDMALGTDGKFSFFEGPESARKEWFANHRFDFDTAMELAVEHANKTTQFDLRYHEFMVVNAIDDRDERIAKRLEFLAARTGSEVEPVRA